MSHADHRGQVARANDRQQCNRPRPPPLRRVARARNLARYHDAAGSASPPSRTPGQVNAASIPASV